MREARYVSLIPRTTLHSDSEQLYYMYSSVRFMHRNHSLGGYSEPKFLLAEWIMTLLKF
jgi:hypothetical protein